MYIFGPYSLPFLVTSLILSFTLALMIRRGAWRDGPSRYLFFWLAAGLEWNICALVESMAVSQADKILWSKIEYLGGATCAPFMLLFALRYTGVASRVRVLPAALALGPSVLAIVLVFLNERFGLIWRGFAPGPAGTNSLVYLHGPAYQLIVVYCYLLALVGSVLFLRQVLKAWRAFRGHHILFLVAVLLCWGIAAAYATGFASQFLPGLDLSPLGMGVVAALVGAGISGQRMLDLGEVAREQVLEHMDDGVLVVDWLGRLVDMNAAAPRLLSGACTLEVGTPLRLPPGWGEAIAAAGGAPVDFRLSAADPGAGVPAAAAERWLSVTSSPLVERGGKGRSWGIVTLRDVTARRLAEERLREQYERIRALETELREQAFRDSLTGLHNRRHLDGALDRELARARRDGVPLALLMADLDHFKQVNDHYGHAAGDRVLVAVGALLAAQFRDSDLVCRYGGEEFVVVLWNADAEAAVVSAERLRAACAGLDAGPGGPVTLSIGVATYPADGSDVDALLKAADDALYQAKAAGRNRVVLAGGGAR